MNIRGVECTEQGVICRRGIMVNRLAEEVEGRPREAPMGLDLL